MKNTLLVVSTILIFILSCTPPKQGTEIDTAGKIEILIYEDILDPENINEIHIADVIVQPDGELQLIILKQEYEEDVEKLKFALEEIKTKKTLPLEVERMGKDDTLVLGEIQVSSNKMPEYAYAVERALVRYGFVSRVS